MSPPLNVIYFAGAKKPQYHYKNAYELHFNYIYTGTNNLPYENYGFNGHKAHFVNGYNGYNNAPDFITPYTTLTTYYIYDFDDIENQPDILTVTFGQINRNGSMIEIMDSQEFNLKKIIQALQPIDSSTDSH